MQGALRGASIGLIAFCLVGTSGVWTLRAEAQTQDPTGLLIIERLPGAGPTVGGHNSLVWDCKDANNGLLITPTSQWTPITAPPKVSCTPRSGFSNACKSVFAGGTQSQPSGGAITVTSACGSLTTSTPISTPGSEPAVAPFRTGNDVFPWTCSVDETAMVSSPITSYQVLCSVNEQASGITYVPSPPSRPGIGCENAVGVNGGIPPNHVYWPPPVLAGALDTCPGTAYSGELGLGFDSTWLFSRAGEGTDPEGRTGQGAGVATCYGSGVPTDGVPTGHHGPHKTIYVQDDVVGAAVGFTLAHDWNRSEDNPFLPNGNDNGWKDCGDSLVEPCDPADPTQVTTPPGCNPLDTWIYVPPGSLVPVPNTWTVPGGGTLGDFAGADGSIVIFINNPFGALPPTTGRIWTG